MKVARERAVERDGRMCEEQIREWRLVKDIERRSSAFTLESFSTGAT